jgi:hypothetical protein
MGAWSPVSRSIYDEPIREVRVLNNNPNPYNFKILRGYYISGNTAVEVLYPDATNYEGKKIMVYKGVRLSDIKKLEILDPHFSEKGLAPFARFEPTEDGWQQAMHLAEIL